MKDAEANIQRTLGIWSIVFAALQAFFFVVTIAAVPDEAPGEAFLLLGIGIVAFAALGVALAIAGLARTTASFRSLCMRGVAANTVVLSVAMLSVAVDAIISSY